jgi:predicted nucleic acid-binding protein
MIVVDTSVWVAAFRDPEAPAARVLRQLLDADEVALPVPARTELLSGASQRDRPALRRALSALPLLYPRDDTWATIDGWVTCAADAGQCFSLGDLLIGVLSTELGALVWSLDADFERMEKLKLLHRYTP